jgi:chromosome partitioning protein
LAKPRLAVAVAEQLMQEDRKHVLLIDLDLQTNATVALISEEQWAEMDNDGRTIAQLFEDRLNPHNTPKFDIPRPLIVWLRGPATGPVYRCARLAST